MAEIQTFTAKIMTRDYLTKDVMRVTFSVPQNFIFEAGQFVNVKCDNNGEIKWKAYSIVNPPSHKDMLELIIKIMPEGFASEVFKNSAPGQRFEIKGPFGSFSFDKESSNTEHIFLGTGTGIAPFYSMIKEHLPKYQNKMFTLLFGVKTKEDLFLTTQFEILQKKFNNFSFNPVLSQDKWKGKTGHVQQHLPENLENKTFYLCGIKKFVLETEALLLEKGVSKENIRKERYD